MDMLVRDMRFALRSLGRRPWFAAAVTLMLAVGIGANAAIFSVVDAVLLRPLPVAEPDRLVVAWGKHTQIGRETASLPDFEDWKRQSTAFSGMTALANGNVTLSPPGAEPERIGAAFVLGGFFEVLGARMTLGRSFTAEEMRYGSHRVAVLSHGLWMERFAGDAGVVGRTVPINNLQYQVVGVAPRDFRFPERARLWAPYAYDPAQGAPGRRSDFLFVVGRLKPEVTIERAQQEMTTVSARLQRQYPETNENWSVELVGLQDQLVSGSRTALLVFMGAVGLVLLVVCANIANLLLSRAATRDREMAIRASLGASRGRLFRQAMVESVVLALAGGMLGMLIATWGVALLPGLLPPDVPRASEVAVSPRVLAFAAAVSLGTGVLFGLAPALRLAGGSLTTPMQEGARGTSGARGTARLRSALVATQVALAMVNLLGCGLLVRSFIRLQDVDLGFATERVLAFQVPLPAAQYGEMARASAFFDELGQRLRALPGVSRVGMTSDLPLASGYNAASLSIAGRPPADPSIVEDATLMTADTGYFGAMGIPLLAGRSFTADDREGGALVTVATQAFARRFFGTESPLGYRVTFGDPAASDARWYTIVGVVGDVRRAQLGAEPSAGLYLSSSQDPQRSYAIVLRTSASPMSILGSVRAEVKRLEPSAPLADVATMEERVGRSLAQPRLTVLLAGVFSILALVLAASGLYAVVAYAVAQRTRELGIRLALGASRGAVVRQVVREGMLPALAGLALGGLLALAASRALASLLYGVSASDAPTFVVVPVLLGGVALLACYFPARAATRVDPATALRGD